NPQTQANLGRIAEIYTAQGRQSEAEPLFRQILSSRETETASSLNALAALCASRNRDAEADSLYKLSISILDKRNLFTAKRAPSSNVEPPSPLLFETVNDYIVLLKRLRRKKEATQLEARVRLMNQHGRKK
ncbi:MAG: tetratricopeptide repeat protein, partial [Bryobacteraceae bacterium]